MMGQNITTVLLTDTLKRKNRKETLSERVPSLLLRADVPKKLRDEVAYAGMYLMNINRKELLPTKKIFPKSITFACKTYACVLDAKRIKLNTKSK